MTCLGHRAVFSGCVLIFRQKNIRTKVSLNAIMCVQASLTNIRSFNAVYLWCYVYDLLLKDKNKRGGCTLFKRHKNIRTKEFIECSNACSSELDVHLLTQCDAPVVLCLRLSFEDKNRRSGCIRFFKTEEQKNKRGI